MPAGTRFDWHTHEDHQLAWAASGVLTVLTAEATWVLPPTRALQDKVLAEAFRVLRPGGTFLGSDSLPSDGLHQFHEGDTYNPVEPAAFLTRLQTAGFAAITLHVSYNLVFTARKAEDSP